MLYVKTGQFKKSLLERNGINIFICFYEQINIYVYATYHLLKSVYSDIVQSRNEKECNVTSSHTT